LEPASTGLGEPVMLTWMSAPEVTRVDTGAELLALFPSNSVPVTVGVLVTVPA
jgi:hypothetical protein